MQTCKVCSNPGRAEIDRAIINGTSLRDIAGRFGLSKSSVGRHKEACLTSTLAKAQAAEVVRADDLMGEIRKLQITTQDILATTYAAGDHKTALLAVGQARKNLELLGQLLGELDNSPKVAVIIQSPEWANIRTAIMDALEDYPEARAAVVGALHNVGV